MELTGLFYVLAALLMLVGIAGVVLPALPGLPLLFAGMLLAAWADGFERVGTLSLIALGVMTAVSFVVDFWATAVGAQRVGASRLALVGAVVGTFVGLFFGLPGRCEHAARRIRENITTPPATPAEVGLEAPAATD